MAGTDRMAVENLGAESTRAGSRAWVGVCTIGIAVFALVTSELFPVGVLSARADLQVSTGVAGLMVTVPGLVAAVSAPLVAVYARGLDSRVVLSVPGRTRRAQQPRIGPRSEHRDRARRPCRDRDRGGRVLGPGGRDRSPARAPDPGAARDGSRVRRRLGGLRPRGPRDSAPRQRDRVARRIGDHRRRCRGRRPRRPAPGPGTAGTVRLERPGLGKRSRRQYAEAGWCSS